jgi:hypothetical protein
MNEIKILKFEDWVKVVKAKSAQLEPEQNPRSKYKAMYS